MFCLLDWRLCVCREKQAHHLIFWLNLNCHQCKQLLDYILKNIERSYEKIFKFVKDIDTESLSSGKSININLIKKILKKNEHI